jgi:hypothetical protein
VRFEDELEKQWGETKMNEAKYRRRMSHLSFPDGEVFPVLSFEIPESRQRPRSGGSCCKREQSHFSSRS